MREPVGRKERERKQVISTIPSLITGEFHYFLGILPDKYYFRYPKETSTKLTIIQNSSLELIVKLS